MHRLFAVFTVLVLLAGVSTQAESGDRAYRRFFPASDFHNLLIEGTPNVLGTAAGTAEESEISSFGISGYAMTAADLVSTFFIWPDKYHNKLYAVACRVVWISDSADDDTGIDWKVGMEEKAFNQETALEAGTAAGLADKIAFTADNSNVQYGVQTTVWDTFSVGAMQTYDGACLVQLAVELDDDGDATGDEPHFLGVELYFIPPDFRGSTWNVPGVTMHSTEHGIAIDRRSGF